jgi:hypothetical protein
VTDTPQPIDYDYMAPIDQPVFHAATKTKGTGSERRAPH